MKVKFIKKIYQNFERFPPSFCSREAQRKKNLRRPRHTRETGLRPARRAEVALLFLAGGGRSQNNEISFSREARRIFFSRIEKNSATNSLTKVLLKSVRLEQFFGFGQNFRKSRSPNPKQELGRRLEQRLALLFLAGGARSQNNEISFSREARRIFFRESKKNRRPTRLLKFF